MILRVLAGAGAASAALLVMGAPSPAGPVVVVSGAVVTQGFGCTSLAVEPVAPGCPGGHFHTGIDLGAPSGTEVHAATAGLAAVLRSDRGYGLHVVVVGEGGITVIYGHLASVRLGDGAAVSPGEVIATVGSSGNSTGPHLHFEVRRDGRPVDPSPWLAPSGGRNQGGDRRWSTE